jgi:NADPH:quinone reductase-like Zn-dependent oxidoreductase
MLDPGAMLFRGTMVRGWWLAHWFRKSTPQQIAGLFGTLIPLVAAGTLRTPIAAEYDLADVKSAVAAAEGSARNGKVLLVG